MYAKAITPCITTTQVEATRDFYVRHFGARVTFDCGWYVSLQIGKASCSLEFMAPQPGQPICNPAGLGYNIAVADVDAEYNLLMSAGLQPVMPLEDHPWGDRGFAIQDPNGVALYIYSEREPSAEFRTYYKT